MKKVLITFLLFIATLSCFAQKEGTYLEKEDPLSKEWRYSGEGEGAPIIEYQEFIMINDGKDDKRNMMATHLDEDYGFACPTRFTVSKDEQYLYFAITSSCALGLSDEDKYNKVLYKLEEVAGILVLTLTIDKKEYQYKERV